MAGGILLTGRVWHKQVGVKFLGESATPLGVINTFDLNGDLNVLNSTT